MQNDIYCVEEEMQKIEVVKLDNEQLATDLQQSNTENIQLKEKISSYQV